MIIFKNMVAKLENFKFVTIFKRIFNIFDTSICTTFEIVKKEATYTKTITSNLKDY